MKHYHKIFVYTLLCCLVLFLTTGEAYAEDVLQAVRNKAANFLMKLRPVLFILAGFGLVGFAWMAIFNKISWKWFANIAMGLFLVANMGLFVDYFATKSGQGTKYAQLIGYGDYLGKDGYKSTSGTSSGPKSQKKPSEDNTEKKDSGKSPSAGGEFQGDDTCVPGVGTNCENKSEDSKDGDKASEDNSDGKNTDGNKKTGDDSPLTGSGSKKESSDTSNPSQSGSGSLVGNTAGGNTNVTPPGVTLDDVEDYVKSGGIPKEENQDSGGGLSYFACTKAGGSWDEASGSCKGAKSSAGASASDDDDDDEFVKPKADDDTDSGSGAGAISAYGCQKIGGTWDGDAGKCNTGKTDNSSVSNPPATAPAVTPPTKEDIDAKNKEAAGKAKNRSSCSAVGGSWEDMSQSCVYLTQAEKDKYKSDQEAREKAEQEAQSKSYREKQEAEAKAKAEQEAAAIAKAKAEQEAAKEAAMLKAKRDADLQKARDIKDGAACTAAGNIWASTNVSDGIISSCLTKDRSEQCKKDGGRIRGGYCIDKDDNFLYSDDEKYYNENARGNPS